MRIERWVGALLDTPQLRSSQEPTADAWAKNIYPLVVLGLNGWALSPCHILGRST